MKLRTTLSALALAATFSAPAFAVVANPDAVSCDFSMTVLNDGYLACSGPLAGAIGAGAVQNVSFAGFGNFTLAGLTGDTSGAFSADPGATTFGELALGHAAPGAFVIGLQGGSTYSLYLFSGNSTLFFDTYGVIDALGHSGPDLTHASLFLPAVAAVPEPATYALMFGGLLAIAGLGARRGHAHSL